MKTRLLNLLVAGLALLTIAGQPSHAQEQEHPTTRGAVSGDGPYLSISNEADWKSKCASRGYATWDKYHLTLSSGGFVIIVLPDGYDPYTLEGQFSNGISGIGEADFIVEEGDGVKNQWTLVEQFSPETNGEREYVYKRMTLKDQTKEIRISYKRGANPSKGAILYLNVYSDLFYDKDFTPTKLCTTDCGTNSATLEWSGSKYPVTEYSKYKLQLYDQYGIDTVFNLVNIDHCRLNNLNSNSEYTAILTRTYMSDEGLPIAFRFRTQKYDRTIELANKFEVSSNIKYSEPFAKNIKWLDGGETLTFIFDNPVGAFRLHYTTYDDHSNINSTIIKYTLYDYDSDKEESYYYREFIPTQLDKSYILEIFRQEHPGNIRLKKVTISSMEYPKVPSLSLQNYVFYADAPRYFPKEITLETDVAGQVTVGFTTAENELRSIKNTETKPEREIHFDLFKTDQEGESTELVHRVVSPDEVKKGRCATGERLEDNILYTAYLYTTIEGGLEDIIWKTFTRADIATGNESITPKETEATIRVADRRVSITRNLPMTGFMQIVSFSGQVVYSQKLHNSTEVSAPLNAPGNYIVQLILSDGATSQKVQVE